MKKEHETLYIKDISEGFNLKEGQYKLTTIELDNLQWAKEFIDNYRKKHKI